MREDRGDAGAHTLAFTERDLSHSHAGHVGDRVLRAGREDARGDAEFASPDTRLRYPGRGRRGLRSEIRSGSGASKGQREEETAAESSHGTYLTTVPLIPLYGHDSLRARLASQAADGTLPSSLLFQGAAGIGKQRLALWLGQVLLCEADERPCGTCQNCRYSLQLQHPDLRWFFPRKNLGSDTPIEEVQEEYDGAVKERMDANGLYARPDGSMGIYLYVTRLIAHMASRSAAMARRKVFVIGDAERMAPQASSQEGANAFLKLLEEPPPDTTFILTSSEPGALLPTIRSRVVSVRVSPLPEAAMRKFVGDSFAQAALPNQLPDDLIRVANGAPGTLIGAADRASAVTRARTLLAAADAGREQALRAAFTAGSGKARGAFTDVLDALTVLLVERARDASARGDERTARKAVKSVPAVEEAKRSAEGNVNPQLVTARLLDQLSEAGR